MLTRTAVYETKTTAVRTNTLVDWIRVVGLLAMLVNTVSVCQPFSRKCGKLYNLQQ